MYRKFSHQRPLEAIRRLIRVVNEAKRYEGVVAYPVHVHNFFFFFYHIFYLEYLQSVFTRTICKFVVQENKNCAQREEKHSSPTTKPLTYNSYRIKNWVRVSTPLIINKQLVSVY